MNQPVQWLEIQAEVSQKDFFIWIWFLFQKKERNGVYGSFVKYPKEMDNPCDETLPSVFHIFPTITINFFQDFLRKKMIKKGYIFGMKLILITKCIFVNHEVNLIWFQSLFFLAKNIFFSNKMVSTSLLAVLGLIYCWSGLVSHLFWKYSNTWEEEILCLCKNTFPQLCFAWNDTLPARIVRCFNRIWIIQSQE